MRVAARQSWDLFFWVSQHAITLEATHNTRADADALSRQWQLSSQVVDRCQIYPGVDLFASPANNHVLQPVSSPPSVARECPVIPWEGTRSLRFPPTARVTRVLLKIELDGAFSILLIAPCWPSRAWFPKLVRLLTGQPLWLPPASRPTGPTSLFRRVVLHQGEISLSLPDQDSLYPDLGCLAPIRESFIKEGFSEEAALMAAQGRRPSTLNLYKRRLRLFGEWRSGRSIGPSEASNIAPDSRLISFISIQIR